MDWMDRLIAWCLVVVACCASVALVFTTIGLVVPIYREMLA